MKKRMKKSFLAAILAISVMTLSACTQAPSQSGSPAFPDAPWGSSIDSVLESLDTSRDALGENLRVSDEKTGDAIALIEKAEVFGVESAGTILYFGPSKDGKGSFFRAEIFYPADADMKKVAGAMEKAFGQPRESVTVYSQSGEPSTMTSGETKKYWQGGLLQDELSKEQKNSLRERIANTGPDIGEKMNDDQWETYLKNPSVTASWYTDYESPLAGAMTENDQIESYQNAVILDATILLTANYDS